MRTLFALRAWVEASRSWVSSIGSRLFENVVGLLKLRCQVSPDYEKGSSRRVFGDAAAGLHRSAV